MITGQEVRELLRTLCEEAGGVEKWAKSHKISATAVWDVLAERRDPGPKLLSALGLKKVVGYSHGSCEKECCEA